MSKLVLIKCWENSWLKEIGGTLSTSAGIGGALTICFITVGVEYLIIPNSESDDYQGASISLGISSYPFWIDYGGQEGYITNFLKN